jgi:hypothetical protein
MESPQTKRRWAEERSEALFNKRRRIDGMSSKQAAIQLKYDYAKKLLVVNRMNTEANIEWVRSYYDEKMVKVGGVLRF